MTKVIVDAMARHLARLRATGTSPRTLTGVCADLNAAGQLVVMYGTLKANHIMEQFHQRILAQRWRNASLSRRRVDRRDGRAPREVARDVLVLGVKRGAW